jgi:hypothetical protein
MDAGARRAAYEPLEMLELLREPRHYSRLQRMVHSTRLVYYACRCLREIDGHQEAELIMRYYSGMISVDELAERQRVLEGRATRLVAGYRSPRRATLESQRARAALAALADSPWKGALGVTRETQHHLQREQCAWLRCLFPNPLREITVDPIWLTSTVLELARGIAAEKAFDRLPILADALQDADCDDDDLLCHCRQDDPHTHPCWVLGTIFGELEDEADE